MYKEIEGNLINLAKEAKFDVIAHGCNCFCTMGAGIAPQMAEAFCCDKFKMEDKAYKGDINKLGTIDFGHTYIKGEEMLVYDAPVIKRWNNKDNDDEHFHLLKVVNCYSQYTFNRGAIDYDALTLCMRKMGHIFKGQHFGLPQIGAGLAGGDWEVIKGIIKLELKDSEITVVIYKP